MAEKVDIFMQFFPADYLADTQDLTTEEHGAYLLLLMALWRHDGKVDNNPARLATTTRVELSRWPSVWAGISRFFIVVDGCISQGRLLSEIERARARKHAAVSNGQKGGVAKARRARNLLERGQPFATSESVAEVVADSGSSSPSPDDLCVSPGAGARDPSGTVPRKETITGSFLTQLYGRTRAQLWPNALEWVGAPASPEKAANMAASIPPDALEDVKKTMFVMLTRVKAGEHRKSAEIAKSPGFGFAVWCMEFHELFEELRGKTPAVPPNGTRGSPQRPSRDQRTGYAEPPPAGTAYPSGKVQLR